MDTQSKVVGLFVPSLTRGFNSETTTTTTDAIIIIIIIILLVMQSIYTYISETMSLGNTVLQLFCCYY